MLDTLVNQTETEQVNTTAPNILTFDFSAAKQWLEKRLHAERYFHSLGAHEKALELAEKFHLSPEECTRAAIAGLLHDAAKLLSPSELYQYCEDHGLRISDVDRATPQTLHPFVGAQMVLEAFKFEDAETLDAIRYHTTARSGMSRVEKVVFVADKIEENTRNPLFVQKVVAHLNYKDAASLDKTMLYLLDSTIAFLMEKRQLIHPRTVDARNDFVSRLKQETRR